MENTSSNSNCFGIDQAFFTELISLSSLFLLDKSVQFFPHNNFSVLRLSLTKSELVHYYCTFLCIWAVSDIGIHITFSPDSTNFPEIKFLFFKISVFDHSRNSFNMFIIIGKFQIMCSRVWSLFFQNMQYAYLNFHLGSFSQLGTATIVFCVLLF